MVTPAIIFIGSSKIFGDESAFLIQEYWKGESGETAMPRLAAAERLHLFRDWGKEVAKLHGIATAAERDWHTIASERLAVLTERNLTAGVISKKELLQAESKIRHLLDRFGDSVKLAPIHGDLYPPNILINQGRFAGLLDFDHAKLFDPCFDFVKLRMWTFQEEGDEEAFMKGYREYAGNANYFDEHFAACFGLELLSGFPFWRKQKNDRLAQEYQEAFKEWLSY